MHISKDTMQLIFILWNDTFTLLLSLLVKQWDQVYMQSLVTRYTWLIFSTVIVVIGWQWHFFVRSIFVFGLWRAGRARWRGGAGNITVSFGFINRFCRLIIHGYWAVQWFWLLIGFTQQRIWLFILCWLLTVFIFWRLHLLVSFRSWPWVLDFSFPLQLWFQDTLQLWLR